MNEQPFEPTGRHHSQYNPVTVDVNEATGTAFLGILALILLIALLYAQWQNRKLLAELRGE
jgi:C4-dicarboxylate-specific signal transduction histidine kinase